MDESVRKTRRSSIFLGRIVGAMFMRVNSKCAHQLRPPSKVTGLPVDSQDEGLAAGAQEECRLAVRRRIQATCRRAAVGSAQTQPSRACKDVLGRVMA